jgi:hypothetical protein
MDIDFNSLSPKEYSDVMTEFLKTNSDILGEQDNEIKLDFHLMKFWFMYMVSDFPSVYTMTAVHMAKHGSQNWKIFKLLMRRHPHDWEKDYIYRIANKYNKLRNVNKQ